MSNNQVGEASSYYGGDDDHQFVNSLKNMISNEHMYKPAEDSEIQTAKDSYNQVAGQQQTDSPQVAGNAAAVRALEAIQKSGGGMNEMIKVAMSEATKLFDSKSPQDSAGKNQAIQQAVSMAIKLFTSQQATSGNQQAAGNNNQQGHQQSSVDVGGLLNMLMGSSHKPQQSQSQQQHSSLDIGALVGSFLNNSNSSSSNSGGNGGNNTQQQQQQHSDHSSFSSMAAGLMSKFHKK